jgi:hypothetical protein
MPETCKQRVQRVELKRRIVYLRSLESANKSSSLRSRRQHKAWGVAQQNPRSTVVNNEQPAKAGDRTVIFNLCFMAYITSEISLPTVAPLSRA